MNLEMPVLLDKAWNTGVALSGMPITINLEYLIYKARIEYNPVLQAAMRTVVEEKALSKYVRLDGASCCHFSFHYQDSRITSRAFISAD
jgi:hypothetical protein